MKVLHLPTSVGGNSWGLAQGERQLGVESKVLISSQNWLGYKADIDLNLQDISSKFGKLHKLVKTFLNVRNKFDIFHFNYGSSLIHHPQAFLNHADLPFYPKNAKLFVTYNGCDARQKYPTMARTKIGACHNPACYSGMCNSGKQDRYRRKAIRKMSRYVKHIWAVNPDLLYFLPPEKSSFLPYSVSLENIFFSPPSFEGKLKIVHAPTNRAAKGSDTLFEAIKRLQKSHGKYFEVMLVENVANKRALAMYQQADIVVDQILIGWYGGFAVEMMAMGKPVIARIAKEDLTFIPSQMAEDVMETLISADPKTIYNVLCRCVEDREFLKQRAVASLEYVNKWHDPLYVAGLTKKMYESA